MPQLTIETARVRQALEVLNPYKGAGPDSLHHRALKILAPYIAEPLAAQFQSLVAACDHKFQIEATLTIIRLH